MAAAAEARAAAAEADAGDTGRGALRATVGLGPVPMNLLDVPTVEARPAEWGVVKMDGTGAAAGGCSSEKGEAATGGGCPATVAALRCACDALWRCNACAARLPVGLSRYALRLPTVVQGRAQGLFAGDINVAA